MLNPTMLFSLYVHIAVTCEVAQAFPSDLTNRLCEDWANRALSLCTLQRKQV